ncbi:hypothetical protein GGX14DRAFT_576387 [Mycena pura]|uniref:Secreted protein n=1 Tax=Mycena pura TaxID=153505 RepID=A0AAD6UXX7_9AGAR|nr:hypothetical protein GGX14DRAFT_576387 [Mycena pura]
MRLPPTLRDSWFRVVVLLYSLFHVCVRAAPVLELHIGPGIIGVDVAVHSMRRKGRRDPVLGASSHQSAQEAQAQDGHRPALPAAHRTPNTILKVPRTPPAAGSCRLQLAFAKHTAPPCPRHTDSARARRPPPLSHVSPHTAHAVNAAPTPDARAGLTMHPRVAREQEFRHPPLVARWPPAGASVEHDPRCACRPCRLRP